MVLRIILIMIFLNIQIYASNHNHNDKHSKQYIRITNIGKKFEQEVEKAKKGQMYQFKGVFNAMNYVASKMVCLQCQTVYYSIIKSNKTIVQEVEKKLSSGELPVIDNEHGHYA